MAHCSSLLAEEQFRCSVCLEAFTQPVSIPCGHNFCMVCIRTYWDSSAVCKCPLCKETFYRRPELRINTFIAEIAAQFKKSVEVKTMSSDRSPAKPGEVSCDICTGTKLKAAKSCLVCLASYCDTHLGPHHISLGLKKHKLINPVENLEDKMCKKHERLLEIFCRTDQTCVCQFCTETDHKGHNTVPVEQECEERRTRLGKTREEMQQMIQERLEKIQKIKLSVEIVKRNVEKEISDSVEVFADLVCSIERSQAKLIMVIEEKRNAAEKQAEGFIKDLEKEITELQRRSTEDHLQFLQNVSSLSTSPLPTKDWSKIGVCGDLSAGTAVSYLEDTLRRGMEKLSAVKLKMMQQYAVDVTLDPDTANAWLLLSPDGKQVRHGDVQNKLPDNPKRFTSYSNVLGKQGFSSGRFYFEVQVKEKTQWVIGVAREYINRKGNPTWSPMGGLWTVHCTDGQKHWARAHPDVLLPLKVMPQKVGVFVDYEEGQVSFYDVEARSHIYSFTGYTFSEKLYPYLNPCGGNKSKNDVPLIITPVNVL